MSERPAVEPGKVEAKEVREALCADLAPPYEMSYPLGESLNLVLPDKAPVDGVDLGIGSSCSTVEARESLRFDGIPARLCLAVAVDAAFSAIPSPWPPPACVGVAGGSVSCKVSVMSLVTVLSMNDTDGTLG